MIGKKKLLLHLDIFMNPCNPQRGVEAIGVCLPGRYLPYLLGTF